MRNPKGVYLTVFYLLLSFVVLLLDGRHLFNPLRSLVQGIAMPVRSQAYGLRVFVLSPLSSVLDSQDKTKRIGELEAKVAQAAALAAGLKSLEEENIKMRALLDSGPPETWEFAPSRVISVSSDTLNILVGYGASVGMPVVYYVSNKLVYPSEVSRASPRSGVFLGKIDKILSREAKVILPMHPLSKISVIVRSGENRARHGEGIVVGKGGKMVVEQVLNSEVLEEGDLVLTSGEGGIPPELLVGYVGKITKSEGSVWQQVEVKPVVDVKNLDYVFLITRY